MNVIAKNSVVPKTASNGNVNTDPYADVAVLIPCYNEEAAISDVIRTFRKALPGARVYVFDNCSDDRTVSKALEAGAIVRTEGRRGKGNVVRRMFADIDAEFYVMVDGDNTYDAASAPELIRTLAEQGVDMVVAARAGNGDAYRRGHRFGNAAFAQLIKVLFGRGFTDVFSGYRVFTRRFVKSCPVLSSGFEIETELSIHALEVKIPFAEIELAYFKRPDDSASKLRTIRDGFRILSTIILLVKEKKPVWFYGAFAGIFALSALLMFLPVFMTYLKIGLVPRFPTAILAAALMLAAILSMVCGLILHTVSRVRLETRRLHYLSQPVPSSFPPNDGMAEQNS